MRRDNVSQTWIPKYVLPLVRSSYNDLNHFYTIVMCICIGMPDFFKYKVFKPKYIRKFYFDVLRDDLTVLTIFSVLQRSSHADQKG